MKLNLIKISQLIIMVLAISTLLGCYNKEEFKQRIKDGWDKVHASTKLKGDFCYYIGDVKFPYTDEPY